MMHFHPCIDNKSLAALVSSLPSPNTIPFSVGNTRVPLLGGGGGGGGGGEGFFGAAGAT